MLFILQENAAAAATDTSFASAVEALPPVAIVRRSVLGTVRAQPDTDADIIRSLASNEAVRVLGFADEQGEWIAVQLEFYTFGPRVAMVPGLSPTTYASAPGRVLRISSSGLPQAALKFR